MNSGDADGPLAADEPLDRIDLAILEGIREIFDSVEQSRTITFDSHSLTIMIRIDSNRDGTARVDGWLAPPQPCEVEIKTLADPLSVRADEQGRFAFTRVPRGTAQVAVRPQEGPNGTGRTVVTPVLIL